MKPVFMFCKEVSETENVYVVMEVTHWNYSSYDSGWMWDRVLGKECLVPEVDIVKHQWMFKDEQEALRKVAELYAAQL